MLNDSESRSVNLENHSAFVLRIHNLILNTVSLFLLLAAGTCSCPSRSSRHENVGHDDPRWRLRSSKFSHSSESTVSSRISQFVCKFRDIFGINFCYCHCQPEISHKHRSRFSIWPWSKFTPSEYVRFYSNYYELY